MAEPLPGPLPPLHAGEVRVYTVDSGDANAVRHVTRNILARLIAIPAPSIEFQVGDKGKPYLRNDSTLYFSISHSHDVSMIAVTRVADVGVDIERLRAVPRAEEILRRFFSASDVASILSDDQRDLRFVEAWTRGEATVKVRGASIWEAATPDPSVTVRALRAPYDYAAAVAVGGSTSDWHITQLDLACTDVIYADTETPSLDEGPALN